MIKGYSEIPENWGNIAPYVNRGSLVQSIFLSKKCFFYDACSFRYHANLKEQDAEKILEYIRQEDGIIVITASRLNFAIWKFGIEKIPASLTA